MEDFDYLMDVLGNKPPEYFYRVKEFVTTLMSDPEKKDSFENEQDFKGKDLAKCKGDAYSYYLDRLRGFNNGDAKFYLPFASPSHYEFNKNSAYSITLSFVVSENLAECEYPIEGQDDFTQAESREIESLVWKEKGLLE